MLATAVVVEMHVVSLYYYSTLSDSLMFVRGRVTSVELRLQSLLTISSPALWRALFCCARKHCSGDTIRPWMALL